MVTAVERHVLAPGSRVEDRRDWPEAVSFLVGGYEYQAQPADWLISQAP